MAHRGTTRTRRGLHWASALALAGPLLSTGCPRTAPRRHDPPPQSQHVHARLPAPTLALATPPDPAAARGGYWLSVDLLGPAAAQQAAVNELSEGLPLRDPAETPPPGIMVGHVGEVSEALQWVARFAFEPRPTLPPHPRALQRIPAPAPAGGLRERHGVTLAAFMVSGAGPDLRPRTIAWPLDQSAVLPAGSTWLPAALVPARAPLFAAPAPTVPPAAEAHDMAVRRGGLYVLGWVDRCTETPRQCLRWAQVVARDGDRFSPGYLPMFQVALRASWASGELPLPRALLVASQIEGDQAHFVLLARGHDNQLRRRTLTTAAASDGWPRSSLRVEGDRALVTLGDDPPLDLLLDATLDARPPRATAEDDPEPPEEED